MNSISTLPRTFFLVCIANLCIHSSAQAKVAPSAPAQTEETQKKSTTLASGSAIDDTTTNAVKKIDGSTNKKTTPETTLFSFNYLDEDLVSVINHFASLTGNNILLPQGGLAIKEKITLQLRKKVDLTQVWNVLLPTILDVAGFSMSNTGNTYTIIKNDKNIGKEPMPLYIGVAPEKLPNTDQRIRYLYYLANIKVGVIKEVLQAIIAGTGTGSAGLLPADTLWETDPSTNALILCAKSNDIKAAMSLILQLDQTGFQETMEIVHLKHTEAQTVAKMFEEILKPAQNRDHYKLDARKEPRDTYFADTAKIVPEHKSNSLILLGRPQAIGRIKEFIYKHIDVELDSGQSMIHVYQLQYLDSQVLKDTLENIINHKGIGSSGQSRGDKSKNGSTERFFEQVIIQVDKGEKGNNRREVSTDNITYNYSGGNKLIIAARNDDWVQIKKLIEQLDIPQSQVLIEVLIVDLSLSDARELGSITRNPNRTPLPGDINFQSAHFGNIIVEPNTNNPQTIKSDLLRQDAIIPPDRDSTQANAALIEAGATSTNTTLTPPPPSEEAGIFANINAAKVPNEGATVISLNDSDGKTWSLLQILNTSSTSKIISHPHVITTNNQKAVVTTGESRLLPGPVGGATGGAATQTFEKITADLVVSITPRISSANLVNLQIDIDINQFLSPSNNTRLIRKFVTNTNVANGSILALGGLVKKTNSASQKETPVLGSIPIIGWLFKDRTGKVEETNLTVFILPTIIEPRLRPGVNKYTQDYVTLAQQYAQEGDLFNGLKDPVTRWFFKTDVNTENILNNFLTKDEFKLDLITSPSQQEPAKYEPEQSNKKKNTIRKIEIVEQQKEQEQHLKDLLKNTENPFLALTKNTTTALQS
ncbi:MAG: hypothetical protein NT124_04535 [Candidatus Dependentiae bacterium]|nr:hypothetical protein [Candidatus Dependentiae bacterium]